MNRNTAGNDWRQMKRVEHMAATFGMQLGTDKFGFGIGLYPFDDNDVLPFFARDTQFFAGNFNDLEAFLAGMEWMRRYDTVFLKLVSEKKVIRKEQDERNRQLVVRIKGETSEND